MIRPSKHAHPDMTVVAVATFILHRLRGRRAEPFDVLLGYVKTEREGAAALFLPAINLLYLLGMVEYRPKTDAFEYTGH